MAAHFFEDREAAHAWFREHHASRTELLVGFFKKGARRPGAGYQDVLDAALCFGWIDGVRRGLDAERWTIRFTPRQPRSIWSAVNIRRVGELAAEGRMQPPGTKAFEARDEKRSRIYAYEATKRTPLGREEAKALKANAEAWAYFRAQRPSYRQGASYWVMTAKKDETRRRRLQALIDCSARGEWLPQYRYGKR